MNFNCRSLASLGMTFLLVAGGGMRVAAQDIGLEIGTKPGPAKVETLDAAPVDLAEYVGRKPVLLEFWATWCGSCAKLEPHMVAMHRKYGDKVEFIGVAVSVNQSVPRVKAYVEKHQLPWRQLFDRKGEAGAAYDVPATSYVVVLDRTGKVIYTGLGGDQDLEPALKQAATP
jgi:thiol-disulfide isomerase/thioredoxin